MQRSIEVPAGGAAATRVTAGETIRIVDLAGQQIGDFVALVADNVDERISTAETMNFNDWNAKVRVGTVLYSNLPRPLFTVLSDTSSGKHDLMFAACTPFFYEYHGGAVGHNNCHDNLVQALQPYGMRPMDLPNPVNLFQHSEAGAGGEIVAGPPGASAGEYIELRAEADAIIAVSSCPVDLEWLGAAEWVATPMRIEVSSPVESAPGVDA